MLESNTTGLPTTAQLLLCCARLTPEPERIKQLLQPDLDWDGLMRLANLHGLRPLLYWHLNAIAPADIPKTTLAELWSSYEITAQRNQVLTEELSRLLRLLESNQIPAIPYKGPVLADFLYGNLALREFWDLDILVEKPDLRVARDLLLSEGYKPAYPLERAQEHAFLEAKTQYHLSLVHPDGFWVELHWKVDPDYPVLLTADPPSQVGVYDTSRVGCRVRDLAPEEMLLILCLHGSKHYWARLCWLVDVAEFIRRHPGLDWNWLMSRAEQLKSQRKLALGLYLAHQLLSAPLPEAIRSKIVRDPEVKPIAARISRRLFQAPGLEPTGLERLTLGLRLFARWEQQVRYCVHVILSPSLAEWTQWALPRHLSFLYLPFRLMRLLKKHGVLFLKTSRVCR